MVNIKYYFKLCNFDTRKICDLLIGQNMDNLRVGFEAFPVLYSSPSVYFDSMDIRRVPLTLSLSVFVLFFADSVILEVLV